MRSSSVIQNIWTRGGRRDARDPRWGNTISASTAFVVVPAYKCDGCGHTVSTLPRLVQGPKVRVYERGAR